MIIPALLAVSLVAAPAKAPAVPKPESAIFAVSECADCRQGTAVVAGGAPGTFTVQWSALLDFEALSRTFDVHGNARPERSLSSPTKAAGVGVTAEGGFVLGWERPGEIFAQRLDASGNTAGDSIHVNAGHPGGVDDDDASIAVRSDGVFMAVWDRFFLGTSTADLVVARRVDVSGALQPEVVLGQTVSRSFPVACFTTSGGSVVAWTHRNEPPVGETPSPAGISLRRTGPDGSPIGEVVEVAAPREAAWDLGLALACAPDGGFMVAWHTRVSPAKSGADVLLQRFNAAGAKVGGLLRVNATVAGEQTGPALLFESGGRLLVAWASTANGKSEIRGRRISAKGKPAGREFVLHQPADGNEVGHPALAAVGEQGRFVLVWREGERNLARVFKP